MLSNLSHSFGGALGNALHLVLDLVLALHLSTDGKSFLSL
jgi:hypothetical protein